MTTRQAWTLYCLIDQQAEETFPPSSHERHEIYREMRAVVAAANLTRACDVIRYWDCWDRQMSCARAARIIRDCASAKGWTP